MKRIILAVLPVLLMSGCSTDNQQNQQVSAAQPLEQPATAEQSAQVQADGQTTTVTQTNANVAAAQTTPATPVANGTAFAASEIQTRMIGTNLKWHSQRTGNDGTMIFLPDNMLQWTSPNTSKGKGEWRFEGNNLCIYYPPHGKWKGLPWRCAPVISNDGKMLHDQVSYWKA